MRAVIEVKYVWPQLYPQVVGRSGIKVSQLAEKREMFVFASFPEKCHLPATVLI